MKSLKPFVSTYENKTYTIYATDAQEAKINFIQNVQDELKMEDLDIKFKELTSSQIVVDVH